MHLVSVSLTDLFTRLSTRLCILYLPILSGETPGPLKQMSKSLHFSTSGSISSLQPCRGSKYESFPSCFFHHSVCKSIKCYKVRSINRRQPFCEIPAAFNEVFWRKAEQFCLQAVCGCQDLDGTAFASFHIRVPRTQDRRQNATDVFGVRVLRDWHREQMSGKS